MKNKKKKEQNVIRRMKNIKLIYSFCTEITPQNE